MPMLLLRTLLLLSLAGCVEHDVYFGGDGKNGPPDSGAPVEECNGGDDDGDGEVDEGFDEDANGRGDCLDEECPSLALGEASAAPITKACLAVPPVEDPWNVVVEWQYEVPTGYGPLSMPAVGNVTDDNSDGLVNELDVPDIAFSNWITSYGEADDLVLISGDGSGLIYNLKNIGLYQGVAIADIDNDGFPEVIAFRNGDRVVALDALGVTKWESAIFDFIGSSQITVADLEGDGDVEVIADGAILEGSDGSTVAWLPSRDLSHRSPIAADLDQDGVQEIVLGHQVFDPAGTLLWEAAAPYDSDVFSAVVDADGDAGGEVVFVTNGGYSLYDQDGAALAFASLPSAYPGLAIPGPPCVADFDGDGRSEVVVSTYRYISMLELDGTLIWSVPNANAGPTGCSGFDFNRDGAAEVVFSDFETFYLLDGRTGAELYTWTDQDAQGGGSHYPVIADVDNDGAAEIVLTSANSSPGGITVFGQADGTWPAAGPTWGVHDFSETNLEPDGGVPTVPEPPWQSYGVFRARPTADGARPDLTVEFTDACVMDCTFGPARVAVQVANIGSVDVDAGVVLEIMAVESDGSKRLVTTLALPALPAGQRLDGMEIELAPEDAGERGFSAVIDPDRQVRECDEFNNTDRWNESYCF